MDYNKRYIPVKCLQIDKEFIPFWKLTYIKHEDYGEGFYKEGGDRYNASYSSLVDCLWDSKQKKVILGNIKDYYPDADNMEFKLDEVDLHEIERTHNSYKLDKVIEIVFEEYDTHISQAKKMDSWEKNRYFTVEEIANMKVDDVYEIRSWKPFYKLESGTVVKWEHQMKHFVK